MSCENFEKCEDMRKRLSLEYQRSSNLIAQLNELNDELARLKNMTLEISAKASEAHFLIRRALGE
jgi:hypothetical protein